MGKWKRLIAAMAAGTIFAVSVPWTVTVSAETESGTCGTNVTWTLENHVLTISGSGKMTDYTEEEAAPWYAPTTSDVRKIVIEDGVTGIGDYAFYYCTYAESVTIPDSVKSIGDSAFSGCISLPSVVIPDSVTSIGEYAFYYCENMTSIALSSGLTCINDNTFIFCEGLKSVVIPDSVSSIGDQAFYYCISLESVTIPEGVKSIGDEAFVDCCSLKSVSIPASVTEIGEAVFRSREGLEQITVSEQNTAYKDIDGVLFSKDGTELICYPIEKAGASYQIPDGTVSIAYLAFFYCVNLTDVTVPASVKTINSHAFYSSALESVHFSDGAISFGKLAFYRCNRLTSIAIPEGVTSLPEYMFYECSALTSVTLPDSLTEIDDCAFLDCTSLTEINIPDGVTRIGTSAFDTCTSLSGIIIPDSVTNLEMSVLKYCSSLTDVTLSNSVTSIGYHMFDGCTSLTEITIPDGVKSFGTGSFNDCTSLTSITIPNSVTEIWSDAFYGCDALSDVYFSGTPSEWNAITINNDDGGNDPLLSATVHYTYGNFSYIVLEDGTIEITDCDEAVAEVEIPAEIDGIPVSGIGENAFGNCTNLINITIPNSVTNVKSDAFSGCGVLSDVYFSGTPSEWDAITINNEDGGNNPLLSATVHYTYGNLSYIVLEDGTIEIIDCDEAVTRIEIPAEVDDIPVSGIGKNAFGNCASLTAVIIPNSVTSIRTDAFKDCAALSNVYFKGSEEDWNAIDIDNEDGGNDPLLSAVIHYNFVGMNYGDLDDDGKVTMTDAYQALIASSKIALGEDDDLTEAQFAVADVDGNGKLTIMDAYWILMYSSYIYIGEEITWEDLLG